MDKKKMKNENKDLKLEYIMTINTKIGMPLEVGEKNGGEIECTPIVGGSVTGKINGEIMEFGEDWGSTFDSRINKLDARYIIKTEDGALIAMESRGVLDMDEDAMDDAWEGKELSEERFYCAEHVTISTGAEKYRWMNNRVFVSKGRVGNECMEMDIYMV